MGAQVSAEKMNRSATKIFGLDNLCPVIKSITLIRVNLAKSGRKVFERQPCNTNDYTHEGKLRLIKAKSFGTGQSQPKPAYGRWGGLWPAFLRHSNVACQPNFKPVFSEGRVTRVPIHVPRRPPNRLKIPISPFQNKKLRNEPTEKP